MFGFLKKWVLRFWALVGFLGFVVGLSGVPGDIEQWSIWINAMIENQTALRLAEIVVAFADYVNHPTVRVFLVVFGLIAIAWPLRWFWRVRHKIRIYGRSFVQEKIWVSRDVAIDRILRSDWAKLKEPHISEKRSLLDFSQLATNFTHEHTVSGMSDREKSQAKFDMFVSATLKSFQRNNPTAFKVANDGQEETELNALLEFLDIAISQELTKDFGDVPAITVT